MKSCFFVSSSVAAAVLFPSLHAQITLEPLATHATGAFNGNAAEIPAYDPATRRLFVSNRAGKSVTVLDLTDPRAPVALSSIDVSPYGSAPLCLDVAGSIVAVALQGDPITAPGTVAFFGTDGVFINAVEVGALPDDIKFTPDGTKVLTANEGEPSADYLTDPVGSVSIIDLSGGAENATVATAGFERFNSRADALRRRGVRIFGPNATVAQDLEPENIAVSRDSRRAWVTLQENNAIAVVDIRHGRVEQVIPLGFKLHLFGRNSLDASDKDGGINIQNWPVLGMYLPDGIAVLERGGETFLFTINEGDARAYTGYSEEARVSELTLGDGLSKYFPNIKADSQLGRLRVTKAPPFGKVTSDSGDVYNLLFSFGARSFSAWNDDGRLAFDSGNDFEATLADRFPTAFNSTDNANKSFDTRSDDKGPEPEELVLGEVNGRTYLFVALERMGGVMIYDVTRPRRPSFVDYVNTRDFAATDPKLAGGLSPEGMAFIRAPDSPIGEPLLAMAFTVSGTVTIFRVVAAPTPIAIDPGEEPPCK